MPKANPFLLSFSSGELSPLFDGRIDLDNAPAGGAVATLSLPLGGT